MTLAADRGPVCPYLGLVDDDATYYGYPSSAQRCHAKDHPAAVDAVTQARQCLVADHVRCGRYQAQHEGGPAAASVTAGATRTRRSGPRPRSANGGARGAGPRAVRLALLGVVLVVVAMVGIVLGAGLAGRLGTGTSASATASQPAVVEESPSPVATTAVPPSPSPTPSGFPAPTVTPAITPTATARPTVTPAPAATPLVHVVRSGETLTMIAARYGVTVAAIQAANGIKDPNVIVTGQKLVIPVA